MASFRPSSVVQKQLDQARDIFPADFKEPSREDFAACLQWQAVQKHIHELESELENAVSFEMGESDFQFSLDGGPVREHSVSAGFLSDVLRRSKELVDSIAAFIIPDENLRGENTLMIDGAFPSSFGLKLHLGKGERTEEQSKTSEKIADTFCQLFDGDAERIDLEPFLNQPDLRRDYFAFIRVISKGGARMVVRTRSYRFGTRLNSFQASQRLEWMDETKHTEENLYLSGSLVGGGLKSGKFEFETGKTLYSGKVSPEAKEKMKTIRFGQAVDTWILETRDVKDGHEDDPRIVHVLMDIDPAE